MSAVKVVNLQLPVHASAPAPITAPAPSGVVPAGASSAPGFWASASSAEKVAIVGGAALATFMLYLAFKPRRRRRRR